jgi:hypothetical protein
LSDSLSPCFTGIKILITIPVGIFLELIKSSMGTDIKNGWGHHPEITEVDLTEYGGWILGHF